MISLFAAGASLAGGALPATATPAVIEQLPGRWSGWGAVRLNSGKSEQVKCIATYFVRDAVLEQNLRCASASYRIDAIARLSIAGEQVTGRWEERSHAATGSVSGRVTGTGFSLSIQGDTFTAVMTLATSPCKQSINIAPRGIDIERIAIGLDKC